MGNGEKFQERGELVRQLDGSHRIEIQRMIRTPHPEGYIGMANLIYSGWNPFLHRRIKGFSLHDRERNLLEFVYLSYYNKVQRKRIPARWMLKQPFDRDEENTYRKSEIQKILSLTRSMHDHPYSDQFEQFLDLDSGISVIGVMLGDALMSKDRELRIRKK